MRRLTASDPAGTRVTVIDVGGSILDTTTAGPPTMRGNDLVVLLDGQGDREFLAARTWVTDPAAPHYVTEDGITWTAIPPRSDD